MSYLNPVNYLPKTKKRIAVAMSGGVDSSVAAYVLAQQGHELVGFTAWTLNGPGKCCNDALVNAGRVCETLGMAYDTVDLRAEFSHYVMDYYNNSYEAGLTPNPCVECNRYVKWEKLVDYAVEHLDVDYVATGHYARIWHEENKPSKIFRGEDQNKDQTYMMARVYQKDLAKTLFPLGDMIKPDVVKLAREFDLPTAYSKESQDICFVLDGQMKYMDDVFGKKPGPIIDLDTGKTVGEHDGYFRYTIGQRKGIGVGVGRVVYVVRVDAKTNTVYIGDPEHLETSRFRVLNTNWLAPQFEDASAFPFEAMIKIRYAAPPKKGTVHLDPADPNALIVEMNEPQQSVTPGQICAFYDLDFAELWGGGYIEKHLTHAAFDPSAQKALPDLFCGVTPAH